MNRALVSLNLVLAALYLVAFGCLVVAPGRVERQLREQVVERVALAAEAQFPALNSEPWQRALTSALAARAEALRSARSSPKLDTLAAFFASLCHYDCPDRAGFNRLLQDWLTTRAAELDAAVARVRDWAQARYDQLFAELFRDLKIFTLANASLCLLAALAARRVRAGQRAPLRISLVLSLSALLGAYLYVFAQSWLETLIFADYLGYGYLTWLALIAAALSDIAFNKGRVLSGLFRGVSA